MKNTIKNLLVLLLSIIISFIFIYLFIFFGGSKLFESGDVILKELGVSIIIGTLVFWIIKINKTSYEKIEELEKRVEELENKKEEQHLKNKQLQLLENLNKNSSLNEVQSYFKEMIKLRSFMNNKENISNIMLLLTEEVGELAKAIRKDATDLKIDSNKIRNYDSIESEIADVFIVLNSICTALDINLFDAIYNKERINVDRKWNWTKKLE